MKIKLIFSRKILSNNIFRIALFLFILYFSFILKAHNYDKTPGMGHLEELAFAWAGINLIETGSPISWSTLDYPQRAEVSRGRIDFQGKDPAVYVRMYKPWLDQPPVYSLISGWFAHLNQANRNEIIPTSYIRLPAIFISTLTGIFLFLVVRILSGYWMALLSLILYSTIPVMVFASRLSVPENLIALFLMICFYLLLKFTNKNRWIYILPLPLLIGIGGLSKATGFFLLPIVLFFLATYRQYKKAAYVLILTLPFIAAFFAYGLYFDKTIFLRIYDIQSHRPAGFSNLAYFFVSPAFDITQFIDSWFIFALLSSAFYVFVPQEGLKKWVSSIFIFWLAVVMFTGGEQDLLPWYRFPAFPLMAAMAAWAISYLMKNVNVATTILTLSLFLGNRYLLVNAFRPNLNVEEFRKIFSLALIPSLLSHFFNKAIFNKLSQGLIIAIIIVGIWMNIKYIYNQFEINCENKTCPFGPTNYLSTIHPPIIWRLFVLN